MSTERLIVELDAKTSKLDAKLKDTTADLDKLGDKVSTADSKLSKLSKAGDVAAAGIKAVATAGAAAVVTITALVKSVAEYSKEIKIASDVSGVAAGDLQLMAHATATVGIDLGKLGDILKDTREKIGDFLNTGGGGFQDFADAMNLTKTEARAVAEELAHLSGAEILQETSNRMKDANVSAVKMAHALEGLASDTTNLIPLLKNGGEEMRRLSDSLSKVIVPLSDDDIDLFVRMGQSTDLAGKALKNLGERILLDLGESFITATEKATFFYASLNKGTEAQKTTRLVEIADEIEALKETIDRSKGSFDSFFNTDEFNASVRGMSEAEINKLLEERIKIQKELAESSFGIGEKIRRKGKT